MTAADATPRLAMRGGRVALGGNDVLRGVDFRLRPSEFVVLLGANGSGKTTLVRALLGLVPLAGGSVELFGIPLTRFRNWEMVGYVPQRVTATSGVPASVHEVVLSGRAGHVGILGRYGRRDRDAAMAALEAVDLAAQAREPVSKLSGGQQQRVLIARALAGEPSVLLLDEPVASVDLAHQESFARIVGELNRRGTAILLVAHALGALGPLVHRSVVLDQGRVVHDGPPLPHPDEEHLHSHHHDDEGGRL